MCEKITECEVADYMYAKDDPDGGDPRKSHQDHRDVHWFHRLRHCQGCYAFFPTAEVDEDKIKELIKLRTRVTELVKTIEDYRADAKSARNGLDQLASALEKIVDQTLLARRWATDCQSLCAKMA